MKPLAKLLLLNCGYGGGSGGGGGSSVFCQSSCHCCCHHHPPNEPSSREGREGQLGQPEILAAAATALARTQLGYCMIANLPTQHHSFLTIYAVKVSKNEFIG